MNSSIFLTKHNYNSIELFYCEIVCTTIFDNVGKCIRTFSVSPPFRSCARAWKWSVSWLGWRKCFWQYMHVSVSCHVMLSLMYFLNLVFCWFFYAEFARESPIAICSVFSREFRKGQLKKIGIFFLKVEKLSVPQ